MPRIESSPAWCPRVLVLEQSSLDKVEATAELLAHLVDRGFEVDLVRRGIGLPDGDLLRRFGWRVRLFRTPMPDWLEADGGEVAPVLVRQIDYAAVIATEPDPALEATVLPAGDWASLAAFDRAQGWDRNIAQRRLHPRFLPALLPPLPHAASLSERARLLQRQGGIAAAIDAAERAMMLGPADGDGLSLYLDLTEGRDQPDLHIMRSWLPSVIRLDHGIATSFPGEAATGGFGWAWPEGWGCWSNARAARIVVTAEPADRPRLLRLWLHATDDGSDKPQAVDVFINGRPVGVLNVPRDDDDREYALPIPAGSFTEPSELTIDFWIHRPAVKTRDGEIIDHRYLGIALSTMILADLPRPRRSYQPVNPMPAG
jgi:hypothetical protein